mmetsp:Transcript_13729/g.39048  ORF Transcript_13729/g.39048 Transcript_13729/m.39048 type:complete len:227 (+) Transcript_13729:227-907(+)
MRCGAGTSFWATCRSRRSSRSPRWTCRRSYRRRRCPSFFKTWRPANAGGRCTPRRKRPLRWSWYGARPGTIRPGRWTHSSWWIRMCSSGTPWRTSLRRLPHSPRGSPWRTPRRPRRRNRGPRRAPRWSPCGGAGKGMGLPLPTYCAPADRAGQTSGRPSVRASPGRSPGAVGAGVGKGESRFSCPIPEGVTDRDATDRDARIGSSVRLCGPRAARAGWDGTKQLLG